MLITLLVYSVNQLYWLLFLVHRPRVWVLVFVMAAVFESDSFEVAVELVLVE